MYPFKKRVYYKNTRGSIDIDVKACIFCGICQKKCPTGALEVTRDKKEWAINRMRCIACNACVEACPKKCLYMNNQYANAGTVKEKEVFTQNA